MREVIHTLAAIVELEDSKRVVLAVLLLSSRYRVSGYFLRHRQSVFDNISKLSQLSQVQLSLIECKRCLTYAVPWLLASPFKAFS